VPERKQEVREMIELPEALTIAGQMNHELKGKRIESGNQGNSTHKFVWYNRKPEEYEEILAGKTIGEVTTNGNWISAHLTPGFALLLGDMGGRVIFHQDADTLPERYHFMLTFEDYTYLTVTIQMWGFIKLLDESEAANQRRKLTPISDEFTYDHFKQLVEDYEEKHKKSIKYFMISKSGISGIGNSYLQDILFRAKIHPKRLVADISDGETRKLYDAIRETMKEAVELGGRYDERDLHNNPGGYVRILDSKARGNPCRECGTPIEKIQYLGGASYFCPSCQL
jgi:formamidopyrimidine-DNA glycosylase